MAHKQEKTQPSVTCFGHEIRSTEEGTFVRHLEHASHVVRGWPTWKQELLGGSASLPSKTESTPRTEFGNRTAV